MLVDADSGTTRKSNTRDMLFWVDAPVVVNAAIDGGDVIAVAKVKVVWIIPGLSTVVATITTSNVHGASVADSTTTDVEKKSNPDKYKLNVIVSPNTGTDNTPDAKNL